MDPRQPVSHEVVFGTRRAEIGAAVSKALREAGIPFQTGVQAAPAPQMVFTVQSHRLQEAQDVVALCLATGPVPPAPEAGAFERSAVLDDEADEGDEDDEERPDGLAVAAEAEGAKPIPWSVVGWCSLLVLAHLALVLGFGGRRPPTASLVTLGALVSGRVLEEPWRLVTSLFLHVDPPHALWNGLSMIVFAVPLVGRLGAGATAAVYLVSGIGGGLLACATSTEATVTVGSSGAVAGLFGAWLVGALRSVWRMPGPARARLRVAGIGLLVLPSLLTPTTPAGDRISVASHVGGAVTGIFLGWLLGRFRKPAQDGLPPAGQRPGASWED